MEEDLKQAAFLVLEARKKAQQAGLTGVLSSLRAIHAELELVRAYARGERSFFPLPHEQPVCPSHREVDLNHMHEGFNPTQIENYRSFQERGRIPHARR